MASRFFFTIPLSILVQDPYEEVFSLFTTETPEAPWTHNRSVSQQSTRLELELDFTPCTSPAASRPGSRPDSRSGSYVPAVTSMLTTPGFAAADVESFGPGARSGSDPVSNQAGSPSSKVKSPANRVPLAGRKSRTTTSSTGSMKAISSQPTSKKPVVIHQSLSTLSQPGQTGTVVWDSSILMAKFLLSIKGLTIGCYRAHTKELRAQYAKDQRTLNAQHHQIRMLEEQTEHLTVTSEGDLRAQTTSDETSQTRRVVDGDTYGNDDGIDPIGDGEEEMLVFDPSETTILELGSGCGLLGIVMVELCKDLLLTDQEPVLPLLIKNLRANLDKKYFDQDPITIAPTRSKSTTQGGASPSRSNYRAVGSDYKASSCRIQVQELAWGQELDQDLRRGVGMDYIIATDVVYNESVVPKLVWTLKSLCEIRERVRREYDQGYGHLGRFQEVSIESYIGREKGGHQGGKHGLRGMKQTFGKTVVLIAQELRTDYVHLAFLEGLQQAGFQAVRMPKQLMDNDYQSGYVIYACSLMRKGCPFG